MIDLFDIIYLFVNAIKSYTVYNIFQVFFDQRKVSKIREVSSYILLFVVTSVMFLKFSVPTLTLLSNIILLTFISFNYESNWKKRLSALAVTYAVLWTVETTVFMLTQREVFSLYSKVEYDSIAGVMMLGIGNTIISLALTKFKNIKKGNDTPIIHWITSVLVPILSIYIGHIALVAEGVSKTQLSLSIIALLIINISIVLVYDIVAQLTEIKIQKAINEHLMMENYNQNKLKLKNYENLDNFRHDQRNHTRALKELIKTGDIKKVENYLDKMREVLYQHKEAIHSGNMTIDTVINYKLSEAKALGIDIKVDSQIPTNLDLDLFTMNIILGNLIDNAIEATAKLQNTMPITINLYIKDDTFLCITIINNYHGVINQQDNKIITTKKDKKNHGIGLRSARAETKKLKGKIIITHTENKFTAEIILPIAKKPN